MVERSEATRRFDMARLEQQGERSEYPLLLVILPEVQVR
jgi:hypothetical protein